MRKGFLIYEEMRKYLTIYEEADSHIWLATAPFWPYIWGKFYFLFYQCTVCKYIDKALSLVTGAKICLKPILCIKLYRNKLFPRNCNFLQLVKLTMHDYFSNRDLVQLHISILLLCTKRPKIDRWPALIDVFHSLAGGEGRGSAWCVEADVPAALAGAAKMRANLNSCCWNIEFVHNHPPSHSNHTWRARSVF